MPSRTSSGWVEASSRRIIDVPTVGRMQMMKDPQGAAFYIIQPAPSEERPETAPEVGEASWHELMTTDAPAALKFYSEIFEWQPSDTMDMGPMGKYHMFNRPHGMIGGMMNKPPEMAQVPAALDDLFPRARHQRRGRAHQEERRDDHQRADGGSRRRLDRERYGSAGRGVLAAREEGGVATGLASRRSPKASEGWSRRPN